MVKVLVTKLEIKASDWGLIEAEVQLDLFEEGLNNEEGFKSLHVGDYYLLSEDELKAILPKD